MDILDAPADDQIHSAPRWRMLLGGVPDFVTAATCWTVWQSPGLLGAGWVKTMAIVVLMEFFVIHSGAFMGIAANIPRSRPIRIFSQLGLMLFYGLFVAAFASGLDESWLYLAFGWLFLSKLLVSWSVNAGNIRSVSEQMIDWPFAVAAYLGSLVTGFVAFEQACGGITSQVFADSGLAGAGLVGDQPWQLLAAGSFYFTLMAVWRMRLWRW